MAIKGLKPSLAEGGKIKIGGLGDERTSRQGKKFRMPVKLDHFVLTTTQRNARGDLVVDERLMSALRDAGFADEDGNVRRLPVILHSDAEDEVFPTAYAMYAGKKLACLGDGEKATQWAFKDGKRVDTNTRERRCPCEMLDKRQCKAHGTLHCSIALPGHAVAGAVHRWRTTSVISIQQLMGSMLQIKQAVGVLRAVPLQLVVRPVVVTPEGESQSTVYVCHLELHATDVLALQRNLLEQAQARKSVMAELDAATRESYRALLKAPGMDESDAEQAEVQQEFHSEGAIVEGERTDDTKSRTAALTAKLMAKSEPAEQPKEDAVKNARKAFAETTASDPSVSYDYGPPPMDEEPPAAA